MADTSDDYDCSVNCASCTLVKCPVGSAAQAAQYGSNECTSCSAGTYATDSTTDFGIVGNATQCLACPDGYYMPDSASVYCIACDAGKSSDLDREGCSSCKAGKSSSTAAGNCTACAEGLYSDSEGATYCDQVLFII